MAQNQNDVTRQAIQAEQEKRKQEKAQKTAKQNEVLSGIIDSEAKTYTFERTLSVNGGEKKTGRFVAKYMGVTARLRIGTIRAKLLDGAPSQSLDNLTDDIAYIIAFLTVALVEKPSWFSFDVIDEYPELRDMFMEVDRFIGSFRQNHGTSTNAGDSSDASGQEIVEDK